VTRPPHDTLVRGDTARRLTPVRRTALALVAAVTLLGGALAGPALVVSQPLPLPSHRLSPEASFPTWDQRVCDVVERVAVAQEPLLEQALAVVGRVTITAGGRGDGRCSLARQDVAEHRPTARSTLAAAFRTSRRSAVRAPSARR
jgi:hypothetical protein